MAILTHFDDLKVCLSEDSQSILSSPRSTDNESILSRSDGSNLIINYLPYSFTNTDLWGLFAEYGRVIECKVIKDKYTRRCVGYGFVRYTTQDEAEKAIKEKNGFAVENKILKVSFARDPSEDIMNCKIYASNIPKYISKKDCESLFSKYGEIIEFRFVPSLKGKKSIAFVQYALKSQAENALAQLNGYVLPHQTSALSLKFVEKQSQPTISQKKNKSCDILNHDSSLKSETETPTYASHAYMGISDAAHMHVHDAHQVIGYYPYDPYSHSMEVVPGMIFMPYIQMPYPPSNWHKQMHWSYSGYASDSINLSGSRVSRSPHFGDHMSSRALRA